MYFNNIGLLNATMFNSLEGYYTNYPCAVNPKYQKHLGSKNCTHVKYVKSYYRYKMCIIISYISGFFTVLVLTCLHAF